MSPTKKLLARADVPQQYKWNRESIFASIEAWEAAYDEVKKQIPLIAAFKGRLVESADTLLAFFSTASAARKTASHILIYAAFEQQCDTTDQQAVAMSGRAQMLLSKVGAAGAFAQPELIAIDSATLEAWMAETPALQVFAHYFERMNDARPHTRSAEIEELLSALSDPFGGAGSTANLLINAETTFNPAIDSDGNEHLITPGNSGSHLRSEDRERRRSAWENFADGYLAHKATLAATHITSVKQDWYLAKAHGYDSSLAASLAPNAIPTDVYHNLIDSFKRNLPLWHRYWRLRRKILGYDKLHMYDLWAPINPNPPEVSYETAVDWIAKGMAPLGKKYVNTLRNGSLEERWVDIYDNKGKGGGAFSWGAQGTFPFIKMQYDDSLFALSTLAHELGHSMHSWYSWDTQPHVYSGYSLFAAEVASNFNQALVRNYLFATQPDAGFQLTMLEEGFSNFLRYYFIMPTLARFELEVHDRIEKGEFLTAKDLGEVAVRLFGEAFGGEVEIDEDRLGIVWAQFGHLFNNFYVFQYMTGIAAAHLLAEKVLKEGEESAENYLDFLRAGGGQYPVDALAHAGVDMTAPDLIDSGFIVLEDMVNRLEKLAKTA